LKKFFQTGKNFIINDAVFIKENKIKELHSELGKDYGIYMCLRDVQGKEV